MYRLHYIVLLYRRRLTYICMHIQSQYWYFICTEKPSSGVKRIQLHCTDLRSTYIKTTNTYYCTYRQYTYMYIHVHIYIYLYLYLYMHTRTQESTYSQVCCFYDSLETCCVSFVGPESKGIMWNLRAELKSTISRLPCRFRIDSSSCMIPLGAVPWATYIDT